MKKEKKQRKPWSKKKKIIVGVVAAIGIIGLLSGGGSSNDSVEEATEAGYKNDDTAETTETTEKKAEKKNAESWVGKAVNVTDNRRKAAYEDILKTELGDRTTSKLKFSGYKMTEKKTMSGEKKGYTVTVSCDKIRIDNGKTYHKGSVIAWVNKDTLSKYKLKKLTFDSKDVTNITDIIKNESSDSVSSSGSSNSNDWNSTTKRVTDSGRIAAYETVFQTELDEKAANLKYPWDYNEYDMIEKKYTYKGKNGYMASVECDKISVKGDTTYHTGRIVFWIDKDMNKYTVSLLEFDGESVL